MAHLKRTSLPTNDAVDFMVYSILRIFVDNSIKSSNYSTINKKTASKCQCLS